MISNIYQNVVRQVKDGEMIKMLCWIATYPAAAQSVEVAED